MQWETEDDGAPCDVDGDAKRRGGERIETGAGENGGKGSLCDEKVFKCAGIAGFFEAAVESVERGIEVIEKNEADEREGKVTAGLGKSLAEFGAIDEAGDVIKGGGAEQGLHDFHDEGTTVGL